MAQPSVYLYVWITMTHSSAHTLAQRELQNGNKTIDGTSIASMRLGFHMGLRETKRRERKRERDREESTRADR